MNLENISEQLDRIETMLQTFHEGRQDKQFYTTEEVAEILSKRPFTIREHCRLGRVNAEKRACGRGNSREWIISHEELMRIKNEGLLPLRRFG